MLESCSLTGSSLQEVCMCESVNAGGVLESKGVWIQEGCLGAWVQKKCLGSVLVLGLEGLLICRRPDLKEVLVVLEEVLGLLEEVLVSGRGAWI